MTNLRFREDGSFRVLQMADIQDGPNVLPDTIRLIRELDTEIVEIEEQIQSDIRYLNELELAIDNVIANCKDIEDKAILEYTKDGLCQQEIAEIMCMERSTVSKRMSKYVSR